MAQRAPLMTALRCAPVCIRDNITKMESNSRKRLKRDDNDGVRAGGEGNVTVCLAVPLLEELIPGIETCFYEGVELRAALFLIDDIICGPLSLLHMQDIYLPTA